MSDLNVKNRTIFCHDNLEVLQGINDDCIDLIYLDPPFNTKKEFHAPTGSNAAGASFSDIFRKKDIKDEWVESIEDTNETLHAYLKSVQTFNNEYNYCYLVYMSIRLIECHRVLKPEGSIYLHCDPTMSHYLKIVMDQIFDEANFRNEIIWSYSGGGIPRKDFPRKHDVVLRFTKSNNYTFNVARKPYKSNTQAVGIHSTLSGPNNKINLKKGTPITDVWADINTVTGWSTQKTGYPTQKPLALLERIIKASSNEGDVVLDPFCGCATTCVAAEKLNRDWIGIDRSSKAYELVKQRLKKEVQGELVSGQMSMLDYDKAITFDTSPPQKGTSIVQRPKRYVYIISNEKSPDTYKVGIATDVKSRLSSYQTGDPDRGFKLEFKHLTPNFRAVEKYIHRKFNGNREWVSGDLDEIKNEIKNYKPPEQYTLINVPQKAKKKYKSKERLIRPQPTTSNALLV